MTTHVSPMRSNRKRRTQARQLSLYDGELGVFIGRHGWTLMFREKKDGQLMAVKGTLQEVYDALAEWKEKFPDYYSAVIYSPNGVRHRTIK